MVANKVIILGLSVEKTGHCGALHSSIILRSVGWQVVGWLVGWLVGRSVNKYQLAPLNIPKRRTPPIHHFGDWRTEGQA